MGILEYLFYAWLIYVVYNFIRATKQRDTINYKFQKAMEDIENSIVICNIETHDDILYMWESDTKKFVTQGKTMDELKENCKKYFPNNSFLLKEDQQ
jgi:hypothetical protein